MATVETPIAGVTETSDLDFLNEYAGNGLETMDASTKAIAYLSLVQPDSTAESEDNPAGTWRNSATGKNYGNMVTAVVLAFKTIWNEREVEPPFRTVGRYEPHSIEVETRQPPKGKKGYPKLINPESGNEIQELFVYAVILPDYPEDGILYFNPTVGNMRTCRSWNTQLSSQLLPNGAQAPIFAFKWNLVADLAPNPQQPTKQVARFMTVQKDSIVSKELFTTHVNPLLTTVKQSVLQITSTVDDSDEE